MNVTQISPSPIFSIMCVRVSQLLKSPTTLTDFAWGAQTEKRTPFLPSFSMKWAPSIS